MTFPPAQPMPGYPPEPLPVSPTRAISYGWNKFAQNPWTWILAVLVAFLLILTLVGIVVAGAMLARGAILELEGRKPRLREFFGGINWGPAIGVQLLAWLIVMIPAVIAGALVGAAFAVGQDALTITVAIIVTVAAVAAVLVLQFLTFLAIFFVVDGRAGAIGAVRASIEVTRRNAGPLLLLAILNYAVIWVGSMACYVGLFVAYPIYLIAAGYGYRVVTGGAVSPDRPQMVMPPPGFGPPPGYGWYPPAGSQGPGGFPPPPPPPPQVQ